MPGYTQVTLQALITQIATILDDTGGPGGAGVFCSAASMSDDSRCIHAHVAIMRVSATVWTSG